jgi:hypothetical protein
MGGFSEFFDSSRHELHELFDGGDSVVAAVTFCTRGRGSDREIVHDEAHTWTLRDGRIARFEWGRDLGAALEAGLRGIASEYRSGREEGIRENRG